MMIEETQFIVLEKLDGKDGRTRVFMDPDNFTCAWSFAHQRAEGRKVVLAAVLKDDDEASEVEDFIEQRRNGQWLRDKLFEQDLPMLAHDKPAFEKLTALFTESNKWYRTCKFYSERTEELEKELEALKRKPSRNGKASKARTGRRNGKAAA